MKSILRISILGLCAAAVCPGLFLDASAQYIQKETIPGFTEPVAVFYAEGMPARAIWPIGTVLTRNGATIRHRYDRGNGNGSNPDINSRVSARSIIAPTDIAPGSWYKASGFENVDIFQDKDQPDFIDTPNKTGCRALTTGGRRWRLPTVRELLLIRVLQEAVNNIYPANPLYGAPGYWASTERSAKGNTSDFAFSAVVYFDFAKRFTFANVYYKWKNGSEVFNFSARCVSDY